MNKKALYESIMKNVSKELKKALNEDVETQDFKPFKVNMLLCLDDEEVKDNLLADLNTIDIKVRPNPYGSHYPEKLVVFTITSVNDLKEFANYFKGEIDFVDHILAKDENDDDSVEFHIENDNGRKKFHDAYLKYVEFSGNPDYKMALKCAKKLAYDIYGGDYNDLYDCMQNNDIDGARELLRAINREQRKRIFSSQEMTYILNNWDAVTDAYDKLD